MAISFVYKFQTVSIDSVPNDVTVAIVGYLADSANNPFIDPNTGGVDTFVSSFQKSKLPASGYQSFLAMVIGRAIRDKYNYTKGATTVAGSSNLTGLDDSSVLVPGLYITGLGIPADTIMSSIKTPNEVKMSETATATGQTTVVFSAAGWSIDYGELDRIVQVINFGAI